MATGSLISFRPAPTRVSASKPDPNRTRKAASASWWAPLFGWQPEPDYIDGSLHQNPTSDPDPEPDRGKSRYLPGCFTEEKAKQLRRKTLESSTFHDAMYHSAIASRLATDLSNRKEEDSDE